MKSGERPIMPQVVRAQLSIITRRASSSSLVRGMMNDRPTRSPLLGEIYVISPSTFASCCMSYSDAIARTPPANPGWVVTSLTRSPRSHTSRGCWRKPSIYWRPDRAGIALCSCSGSAHGVSVPRPGKASEHQNVPRENLLLARPFARRQLIGHLDPIAVEIAEVDPARDTVVGDTTDGDASVLQSLVEFPEVVEAL